MQISKIQPPINFHIIDNTICRCAQPKSGEFVWLKENNFTDVVNFRTMFVTSTDFDEDSFVKQLGMNYHSIPSITASPSEDNVKKFLTLIENIKSHSGHAIIHCKAGADRTGMYAFIYKMIQGIDTESKNIREWLIYGHNSKRYPNLIDWAVNYVKQYKK